MKTLTVTVGDVLIGSDHPIVVQTMCNTPTADIDATASQCRRLACAGAQLIRITTPSLSDVEALDRIGTVLRSEGITVPLVADVHFSADIAKAAVRVADKVRINPGNFHPDHERARVLFGEFLDDCKQYGKAIRIGLNHGSLGKYIIDKYGNTPQAMALAAMEWIEMCLDKEFYNVVVSLKASNTVVMVEAYRTLARMMQERGVVFPLHVGVTEAGNGDSGRIKSCVAIATLLEEGIGNTVRVSLTEDPENEIPVARFLAERYGKKSVIPSEAEVKESHYKYILEAACKWGPALLNREIDDVPIEDEYLRDELLQACRRRFYKPEYIACPGCGRTKYDLENTFNRVKEATAAFKDVVIAVMGCIVNGPGEMADADYGYVGEGAGKVTLYRKQDPVLRHIPESEAVAELVRLITSDQEARR
ncbi:MAG: (E)-4-hydroxy-3-methylbut-2-enyl-diphosphate synthase [Bacteroidales bacterium]|nr:(E)-4-hydroxy-3-methylbut-2-enyl-diphosphate synthase [Bacteroidales bacterium]